MNQNGILSSFYNSLSRQIITKSVFFVAILLILSTLGAAADVTISPEKSDYEANVGDTLILTGNGVPDNIIIATISHTINIPTDKKAYTRSFTGVVIPEGTSKFTIIASTEQSAGIAEMTITLDDYAVSVYNIPLPVIVVSRSATVNNGIATLSQPLPAGTYDVTVSGKTQANSAKNVDIDLIGNFEIQTDQNGAFSSSYETANMPSGDYTVKIDTNVYRITLNPVRTGSLDNERSSSQTGTELRIIPADDDTPIADTSADQEEPEQETVFRSPAEEETPEPEDNTPQQTVTQPQPTIFRKIIGWLGSIFS